MHALSFFLVPLTVLTLLYLGGIVTQRSRRRKMWMMVSVGEMIIASSPLVGLGVLAAVLY